MEFLSKLFVQTRSHLTGLSLSQRLAIASCVGVIALSLVWLTTWASEPDRVPLLDQPMSPEEVTQIQTRLDAVGINYTLDGERIMVPAGKRSELLARLSEQRLLPDDIGLGFKKIIQESTPWGSMREQDRRWGVATANELARVLRKLKGVRDARVFIDKVGTARVRAAGGNDGERGSDAAGGGESGGGGRADGGEFRQFGRGGARGLQRHRDRFDERSVVQRSPA